jgi:hypothetical protein
MNTEGKDVELEYGVNPGLKPAVVLTGQARHNDMLTERGADVPDCTRRCRASCTSTSAKPTPLVGLFHAKYYEKSQRPSESVHRAETYVVLLRLLRLDLEDAAVEVLVVELGGVLA